MALQSQIEEADRARRGARRADGYSDHLVSLARAEEAIERAERERGYRLARREGGRVVVEALGLGDLARDEAARPRPAAGRLGDLLSAIYRGDHAGARRVVDALDPSAARALRDELAALKGAQ